MTQITAPHFNFQPHLDAYQKWEQFQLIRQAQLGSKTHVAKPHMFDWTMELAWFGYLTLERQAHGSSKDVGKNFVFRIKRKRAKQKLRARDRAA
jgi:hypothetical protein